MRLRRRSIGGRAPITRVTNVPGDYSSRAPTIRAEMKSTGDDWLGVPAVARRLGLAMPTLHLILDSGKLPAYKFGRVIRIRRTDVNEYLERVKIRPGELAHLYPPGENGDPPRSPACRGQGDAIGRRRRG